MNRHVMALTLVSMMLLAPMLFTIQPTEELDSLDSQESTRSASNALLWGVGAGGSSSTDSIQGIAMDAQGRTYVCGYFYNTANFGPITLSSYGSYDIFESQMEIGIGSRKQEAQAVISAMILMLMMEETSQLQDISTVLQHSAHPRCQVPVATTFLFLD